MQSPPSLASAATKFLLPILLLSLALVGCDRSAAPPKSKAASADLAGNWQGAVAVGNLKLRLLLKIVRDSAGKFTATLDSLDQGVNDIPVSSVLYNFPALKLELEGIGAAFNGKINPEGTEIAGTWEQGGRPLPLVLSRQSKQEVATAAAPGSNAFQVVKGAPADIRGYWKGTLEVGENFKLRLVLKIAGLGAGKYRVTMDSLDQGARNIPANSASYKKPEVNLAWPALAATFRGTLSDDGNTMDGNWEQGGRSMPLKFERTEEPDAGEARDFSFDSAGQDIKGYWQGSLQLPAAALRLVLRIGQSKAGIYRGWTDSPDQGARDLPITTIAFNKPSVKLEWSGIGAVFDGSLSGDGNEISGQFEQLGQKHSLTFKRTAKPEAP